MALVILTLNGFASFTASLVYMVVFRASLLEGLLCHILLSVAGGFAFMLLMLTRLAHQSVCWRIRPEGRYAPPTKPLYQGDAAHRDSQAANPSRDAPQHPEAIKAGRIGISASRQSVIPDCGRSPS